MGKNHACVVIGSQDTSFLLILIPYTLGNFLKMKTIKNTQTIALVWWLGVRHDFFLFFVLRPYTLGNMLRIKWIKHAQQIVCVVIGDANAIFLLISRPYRSGDLLKIKWIKNA